MPFREVRLPECVSYGMTGGSNCSTQVVSVASGAEQRVSNWAVALGRWDIEYVRDGEGLKELQHFFRGVKGRFDGFRFKDWFDYTVSQSESLLLKPNTLTPEVGGKYSQISKYYGVGGYGEVRPIKKPVAGTFQLYKDGVLQTGYTLNTTSGVLSWDSPLTTVGVTNWSVSGTTATITTASPHGFVSGKKISFSGVTGSGSAYVNDVVYTATTLSANQITITLPTTGLAFTGGNLVTYPTSVGVWTFETEFDVPVRFDTDSFQATITDSGIYTIHSLPIVELR